MATSQKIKQKKLAEMTWARYRDGLSRGHLDYQEAAVTNENFYWGAGNQWTEEEKQALGNRPWLEPNLIFHIINTVVGYQTQSRMDITYKPRESGDDHTATVLSQTGRFVLDQNKYPWVEKDVFEDGLIQQRGYFDVRVNFDNNSFGDIVITDKDPLDIIPDPDAKSYDPDEWTDVTEARWALVDDLALTYGTRKANEVRRWAEHHDSDFGPSTAEQPRNKFSRDESYVANYYTGEDETLHARVIERQYWKLDARLFWIEEQSGEYIEVPDGMTMREARKKVNSGGREVVRKLVKRIRWTVATEDVVLHDDWSPYDHFTIIPYFPFFRRGRTLGLVDNLISSQKMINKVYSQMLHVVNTTANSGWIVQENSLTNMDTEQLEEVGAQTGLVVEYKKGYDRPDKIEPNQVPTGLANLLSTGTELIETISGVPASFKGEQGTEVSGIAIQSRVQQAAVQLASPIDNLFLTRHLLADRIVNLIQTYMTEPRIINIIGEAAAEDGADEEKLEINQELETGEILNDVTVGKYDVVVADVPTSITFKQAQLQQLLELQKYGVPVPPEEIVLLTDVGRKQQIADKISGINPEQQELQRQQSELALKEMTMKIEKLEADAQKSTADAVNKAVEAAIAMIQNPGTVPVAETILDLQETPQNEVSAPGSEIPVTL